MYYEPVCIVARKMFVCTQGRVVVAVRTITTSTLVLSPQSMCSRLQEELKPEDLMSPRLLKKKKSKDVSISINV